MQSGMLVLVSVLVPFACLGLLLWMAWLEDTLGEDVQKTQRRYARKALVTGPTGQPAAQSTVASLLAPAPRPGGVPDDAPVTVAVAS